jgi:hypothetical protein
MIQAEDPPDRNVGMAFAWNYLRQQVPDAARGVLFALYEIALAIQSRLERTDSKPPYLR